MDQMCTEGHGNRQATAASVPPRPSQIQGADGMGGVGLGNKHERRNHWKIIGKSLKMECQLSLNQQSWEFSSMQPKIGVFEETQNLSIDPDWINGVRGWYVATWITINGLDMAESQCVCISLTNTNALATTNRSQNASNCRKNTQWLVVWNMFYFSIYWECHHPNWRSHIFQRGRSTTNQID